MLPSLSSVTPHGWLNSPSPDPALPHVATSLPSGVNTCSRLLPLSTTMTLPFFSTASPAGRCNSPSPLPVLPHLRRNLPLVSNTEMVLVHSSEQNTSPLLPTATPNGQVALPSPWPCWKNSATSSSSPGPPSLIRFTRMPKLFSLPRLDV